MMTLESVWLESLKSYVVDTTIEKTFKAFLYAYVYVLTLHQNHWH